MGGNQLGSMANRLNNSGVSCGELEAAGGVYDIEAKCYRFPDGSTGRLIAFRSTGMTRRGLHGKFILLRKAR